MGLQRPTWPGLVCALRLQARHAGFRWRTAGLTGAWQTEPCWAVLGSGGACCGEPGCASLCPPPTRTPSWCVLHGPGPLVLGRMTWGALMRCSAPGVTPASAGGPRGSVQVCEGDGGGRGAPTCTSPPRLGRLPSEPCVSSGGWALGVQRAQHAGWPVGCPWALGVLGEGHLALSPSVVLAAGALCAGQRAMPDGVGLAALRCCTLWAGCPSRW